jgi:hypothetical protein
MKKGLLGLLVIALTIVGCQNYDDQFDDLNSKISSLATTVDGLLAVQTTVANLSTKLDNLASTALTDSDLAGILDEVAAVKQSVADLSLADDLATIEGEVADLDEEVELIIGKLNELLTANAVINQNIRITSLAELSLAEDLISTGADDPNVTINGSFIVNTTGTSDISAAADVARLNAVMDKIKVVMKTVTLTTDEQLTAASLQYIQGNLDIAAATGSVAAGALTTVTGAMTINQGGAIAMSTLNSVAGGITISTAGVTVTSVDLSGLTEGAVITAAGTIALPNATSVKISSVLPATVNVPLATTFESSSQAAQGSTTITVDGSTSFSLGSSSFSGSVVITAKGDVNLAGVTTAKALNITSDGAVNLAGLTKITETAAVSATSVNIGDVTSIEASTVVTSTDVTLSALTSVSSPSALVAETLKLVGPTSVSVPGLTSAAGNIVAANATTFAAVALSTTTGTIDVKAGATVHLKDLGATNDLPDFATIANLKLVEQNTNIDFSTAAQLVSLDYTGKKDATPNPGGQANTLTITSGNASLTSLIIGDGGIGTLTVSGSTLTSLSTAGVIINTVVKGNAALETFAMNHTHLDGDNATTISVTDNTDPLFVALDMSSLRKVKHVNITGNTSLTTITAPGTVPAAEPIAVVTITLDNNLTTGTYTAAVAGAETEQHQMATLTGLSVTGFKTMYDVYKAQANRVAGTVTMSIEIDSETAKIAADNVAQTAGANNQLIGNDGKINDDKETVLLTD